MVLQTSSAAVALGLYLGAGLLATRVPALAPFGPKFSRATTGFVVGFVPGSWVVRALAAALWSTEEGGGSGGVLFASAVASAVGFRLIDSFGDLDVNVRFDCENAQNMVVAFRKD